MNTKNRKISFIMDGNFNEHEGEIYSPHMHHKAFAGRFSPHFGEVEILGRAFPKKVPVGAPVTAEKIYFKKIPHYRGLIGLARRIPSIIKILNENIKKSDILILRFPGNISSLALLIAKINGKKFSVEVVAEPRDYYSKKASTHPLRWLARAFHANTTRIAAQMGVTVRYVTNGYLQSAYPAKSSYIFGFSDVYLPRIELEHYTNKKTGTAIKIVNVAMMHNQSKGHIQLLHALKMLHEENTDFECTLIGDGALKDALERLSEELGISHRVNFAGLVSPSETLWREISKFDLFILPSFQEGLPRALLEAMAIGLPCIASNVGGIPELLPSHATFQAGSSQEIYNKIRECHQNKDLLKKIKDSSSEIIKKYNEEYFEKRNTEYINTLIAQHENK